MRLRLIGATLTILGDLILLVEPAEVATRCAGGCREQGASSWWGLVDWPAGGTRSSSRC